MFIYHNFAGADCVHARVALAYLANGNINQQPRDQFTYQKWRSAINEAHKASHYSEARADSLKRTAKYAFKHNVPVVVPLVQLSTSATSGAQKRTP
jgi:hypothetical protein